MEASRRLAGLCAVAVSTLWLGGGGPAVAGPPPPGGPPTPAAASAVEQAGCAEAEGSGGTAGPGSPCAGETEGQGGDAVIRDIQIRVRPIFDPELPAEDRRLFRLANRLHRSTRSGVIRRQLLFEPGDRFSPRLLEETERLLRHNAYLHDATIRPVRRDGNRVDVEVVTQDVWTLNLGASFGRGGGENSTQFKIEDRNLLGTGRGLTIEQASSVDRSELFARYVDQNLLGTRARLETVYSDNSDGSRQALAIGRPFYSLDSRWAAGLRWVADDRVDSLYGLGEVLERFRHRQTLVELEGGWSRGLVGGSVERWSVGMTFQEDRFAPDEERGSAPGLPADRRLVFPWVAFESVTDGFVEGTNLDQIQRTEDLALGGHYRVRLGLSSTAFGASEDAAIVDATAGGGARPGPRQTLTWDAGATGRWGRGGPANLRIGGQARFYWRDFGEHLFFATLEGDVARRLDPENQLLLGGDSGLRGYPLRYQAGDERLLLTLEQRFFTGWHPLQLFHVGAAAFFDVGRTWPGAGQQVPNLGLLKDVGVGLRLSSRRSGLGSVIHLDVAFPLDGDGSIESVQWLVESKSTF